MSDYNIPPFDIQIEIMKRLPVKSLMKFRAVSKPWKSIIHSSQFIADYNSSTHHQQLLVTSYDQHFDYDYVHIFDDYDDGFPQYKFPLTFPGTAKQSCFLMIGSSQGLFGFYNFIRNTNNDAVVVIWNPSIRKSVVIPVPNVLTWPYDTVVGFSVCNATDPVIVKINNKARLDYDNHRVSLSNTRPFQVEVFTLSSGAWRSLSNISSLPRKSLSLTMEVATIDRFIYWIAIDRTPNHDFNNLILSFDMTREQFTELYLPPSLALAHTHDLRLFKFKESLVVRQTCKFETKQEYRVWMMELGVQNSFRILYTVKKPVKPMQRVAGFRNNGQPIIQKLYGRDEHNPFFVYEPESESFDDIGISGNVYSSFAGSYTGTLLLLDH